MCDDVLTLLNYLSPYYCTGAYMQALVVYHDPNILSGIDGPSRTLAGNTVGTGGGQGGLGQN